MRGGPERAAQQREGTMSAHKSKTHSQGGHSVEVYKGYLIQPALMGDMFYVQKDGFTIASCPTHAAAKAAIDEVTR